MKQFDADAVYRRAVGYLTTYLAAEGGREEIDGLLACLNELREKANSKTEEPDNAVMLRHHVEEIGKKKFLDDIFCPTVIEVTKEGDSWFPDKDVCEWFKLGLWDRRLPSWLSVDSAFHYLYKEIEESYTKHFKRAVKEAEKEEEDGSK